METKYRPLSADHARLSYQELDLINTLNKSNSLLERILNNLDNENEKINLFVEERLNEMKNEFDKSIDLLLKELTKFLFNKGLIKETYFEKVKYIIEKINKGEKMSEEDKKILRESRRKK